MTEGWTLVPGESMSSSPPINPFTGLPYALPTISEREPGLIAAAKEWRDARTEVFNATWREPPTTFGERVVMWGRLGTAEWHLHKEAMKI